MMAEEKQIEELTKELIRTNGYGTLNAVAYHLYNAGYRKQSRNTVELPCRIGDKVYSVLKLEDMDHPIIDVLTVTEVGQRYIFCSAYNPPRDDITEEIPVERIGVDIFLSRLDAETALAKLKGVM